MEEIPIHIEMDQEIEKALAGAGYNIREILNENNIDAGVTFGSAVYENENGARTKDVATIVMASAAAAYLVSKAVTNVLREIYHRPFYDEYYELEPVLDGNGNVIFDPETGKPLMKSKKEHFVFEPGKGEDRSEVTAGLKGLVMKFRSKRDG